MSSDDTNEPYLTTVQAGKLFPVPIGFASVLHRMKHGIDGVLLKSEYDGKRYLTKHSWIREFLQEITEKRQRRFPVAVVSDEIEAERIKNVIEHIRSIGKRKKPRKSGD